MGCRDIPTDKEIINSLWQEIQILGQRFCAKWGGNICIVSWNTLLTWFVVAFIVSSSILLLLVKCQQLFLWIPLSIIFIQLTSIIKGLVKIKYTLDPNLVTSLINCGSNIQTLDFRLYNTLTRYIDHGSNGSNIYLLIICLSLFFLLIFCSSKLQYRKMLKALLIFNVTFQWVFTMIGWINLPQFKFSLTMYLSRNKAYTLLQKAVLKIVVFR